LSDIRHHINKTRISMVINSKKLKCFCVKFFCKIDKNKQFEVNKYLATKV